METQVFYSIQIEYFFKNIYIIIWLLQAPECVGFIVMLCGLSCPKVYGILVPLPGIKPESPASLSNIAHEIQIQETPKLCVPLHYKMGGAYLAKTHKVTVSYLSCLSRVKVAQLCLTLCDPTCYIVHGILQTRILEWLAFPFSRGSSQPRD